jgi:YHS domain-containing protein
MMDQMGQGKMSPEDQKKMADMMKMMEQQQQPEHPTSMTMKESKSVTKDPICGMTVDEATALHVERDGTTFYSCSDHYRQKVLSAPANAKPGGKSCCSS